MTLTHWHRGVLFAVGGVVLPAVTALSQTRVIPQGYMWSSHVPPLFDFAANPMIKRMIHINVNSNIYDSPDDTGPGEFDPRTITIAPGETETGAFQAGRAAAKRVAYHNVQPGDVVILLDKFGLEGPPETAENISFYRPEDRRFGDAAFDEDLDNFPNPRTYP